MQLCTAVCEKIIRQKFKKLGRFIATYPRKILVFVAIFSTLCLIGLINFDQINDAKTQLSPTNARSQIEFKKIERFLQQNGTMNIGHIILQAADNRSLFRNREMDQLYWLTRGWLIGGSIGGKFMATILDNKRKFSRGQGTLFEKVADDLRIWKYNMFSLGILNFAQLDPDPTYISQSICSYGR